MRNFPIFLMHSFGPTPETTLSDGDRLICREIFVQVKTVVPNLINHKSHLVLIMRNRSAFVDFGRKVCRCNVSLPHGHVAHLRSIELCAVADGVDPLQTSNTHGRVDVYVAFFVCDTEI